MNQPYEVILQFRQHSASLSTTDQGEHYQIEVIKAPGRGWGGPMQITGLDENQIQVIRTAYRGFVARQLATGDRAASEWTLHPLRVIGSQLFRALPESVQQRLYQAQAKARDRERNLEVMLLFEPTARSLLDLPWELLHDPDSRSFFALRGGGVLRQLLLPAAPKANDRFQPQSTLALWAESTGVAALDERRRWGPAPGNQDKFTWLQGADSLGQLQHALDEGGFDSLHIVAHGRVGPQWDYALALVDKNGGPHWLSPDQFSTFLNDYPEIRLVYLDVCAGDEIDVPGSTADTKVTSGDVAALLSGAGTTAVVLMQDQISQAASGLMASVFYRELAQKTTLAEAITRARRAVRLQQNDVIHWSVPVLYTSRQPEEESSQLADWILDTVAKPATIANFISVTMLAIVIGRLSYELAQINLRVVSDWLSLSPLLVACTVISVLAAALSHRGQKQLEAKYQLNGRDWLPVLLHKYFSAFVWSLLAWILIWLGWLGLFWSGTVNYLTLVGRQAVWALGLVAVGLASHIGARQAIRQDLLFRRVGFSLFRAGVMDIILALFFLLIPPFLPILFLLLIRLFWQALGGSPAGFSIFFAIALALLAILLHSVSTRRE